MASIFSKIVAGEIPCHKVAEDEKHLAFLDISPLVMGHVLVIPKKEVDYIFDMDDESYLDLQAFVKKVASGLKKAIPCERIGITVMGLEVPHTHVHLIPFTSIDDMNFSRPKLKLSAEQLDDIAQKISTEMAL
ncbi:HIT family protein [Desertivirga xinjiangensis]|uniref:HIT family protein n=1 Tax=Desertivirga xinjiangensis TaxID=539206 RepID=UPI00210ABE7C|nr:HIT family protein [Pedobacter xinjiangensis]